MHNIAYSVTMQLHDNNYSWHQSASALLGPMPQPLCQLNGDCTPCRISNACHIETKRHCCLPHVHCTTQKQWYRQPLGASPTFRQVP